MFSKHTKGGDVAESGKYLVQKFNNVADGQSTEGVMVKRFVFDSAAEPGFVRLRLFRLCFQRKLGTQGAQFFARVFAGRGLIK